MKNSHQVHQVTLRNVTRVLIYFFIFSLASSLMAYEIFGKIVKEDEEPLSNVLVSTDIKAVFSDEKGFYRTEINSGEVTFHKMGFEDIVYFSNSEIPEKIVMRISPIPIEGARITGEKIDYTSLAVSEKDVIIVEDNFSEVKHLLESSGSVHLKGNALPGEDSSISIMGNLSKHTLVMLDGISLNADGREFDITSIPSEIVSKIEIVKSASGVNAGSGNIGGVINIITHNISDSEQYKKKREFSLSQTSGSFGYNKTVFSASYKNRLTKLHTSISNLYTRNDFEYKFNLTNEPEIRKRENNLKNILDFNFSGQNNYKGGTGKVDVMYKNFRKGLPGPINELSKNNRAFIKGSNGKIIVSYNRKSDDFLFKTKIFQFADKSIYDNTESSQSPAAYTDESKQHKTGFILDTRKNFNEYFKAGFGSEFTKQHYENKYHEDVILADANNYAIFTDVLLEEAKFPFTLHQNIGGRIDVNDNDERTENYKSGFLNASIEYESDVTIKSGGGISSTFSQPSFYDLYWQGDSQAVGNPDLEAETAVNKNMYLRILNEFGEFKTSYNMQSIHNLIYWYRSVNYWTAGNIADAEINNLEMNFKLEPNGFWLSAEASYLITDATDKTKLDSGEPTNTYDRPLTYVPEEKSRIVVYAEIGKIKTSVSYIKTGKQYTLRDNDNFVIDEYGLVNADFSYLYENRVVNINFFVKLNNIFDEKYEEYLLVPKPGFNWQAGFKINL